MEFCRFLKPFLTVELEREPIYQVISERSVARKKEFVMQCIVNDKSAQGIGPNKKTAKKLAAEAMLAKMGHAPSIAVSLFYFT